MPLQVLIVINRASRYLSPSITVFRWTRLFSSPAAVTVNRAAVVLGRDGCV
jgi:hypothetical protein